MEEVKKPKTFSTPRYPKHSKIISGGAVRGFDKGFSLI